MLEELLNNRQVIKNPNRATDAEGSGDIVYATLEDLFPLLAKSKGVDEKSGRSTASNAEKSKLHGVTLPEEVSTARAASILASARTRF